MFALFLRVLVSFLFARVHISSAMLPLLGPFIEHHLRSSIGNLLTLPALTVIYGDNIQEDQ